MTWRRYRPTNLVITEPGSGTAVLRWAPRRQCDAVQHDAREPRAQAGRDGNRASLWGEPHPGQDLPVHRADDQRRGGIDVHAGADPAEALLTAQVGGQQVRQPAPVVPPGFTVVPPGFTVVPPGFTAVRGGRVERRVTADHRMEPGEDLRLPEQPGERGGDPQQGRDAAVDERLQVLRDRALPRRR